MILILLLAGTLCGCSDSPETKVEQSQKEAARVLANAKKLLLDLAKSEVELTKSVKVVSDERVKLERLVVTLGGVLPNPVPSPAPNPTPVVPQPPVPSPTPATGEPEDGRFEIAKAVYRIAMAVDSPDKVTEAHEMAAVFDGVASQLAAGTLNGTLIDPQWHRVSLALTAGNKAIIAKHKAAWKDAAEQLSAAIAKRYEDGKLNENKDWADLLSEIARGLKAVK